MNRVANSRIHRTVCALSEIKTASERKGFMIERHIYERIRNCGPGRGTAICLGDQIPSFTKAATKELLTGLGYEKTLDVDYNGNASFEHDLNFPILRKVPRADLIYDGGTMEHVANI